ncbi:MAG: galactokinase, partial [Clostridia bacterium]|nr:galactokinase [Clostridia bacterium]
MKITTSRKGEIQMQEYVFSAPGRTEISGNHTDHQCGCVLAASVNLKTTALVTLNGEGVIRVQSEGYAPVEVDLARLEVVSEEKNSTAALVRGVAAAFSQRGAKIEGFDAKVSSTVLPGSGLSSSAAFEVLIGNIINSLFFGGQLDAVEIAKIGQYAENVHFGKPCGL